MIIMPGAGKVGKRGVGIAARPTQEPTHRSKLQAEKRSPSCEISQAKLRPQANVVAANRIRGMPALPSRELRHGCDAAKRRK